MSASNNQRALAELRAVERGLDVTLRDHAIPNTDTVTASAVRIDLENVRARISALESEAEPAPAVPTTSGNLRNLAMKAHDAEVIWKGTTCCEIGDDAVQRDRFVIAAQKLIAAALQSEPAVPLPDAPPQPSSGNQRAIEELRAIEQGLVSTLNDHTITGTDTVTASSVRVDLWSVRARIAALEAEQTTAPVHEQVRRLTAERDAAQAAAAANAKERGAEIARLADAPAAKAAAVVDEAGTAVLRRFVEVNTGVENKLYATVTELARAELARRGSKS